MKNVIILSAWLLGVSQTLYANTETTPTNPQPIPTTETTPVTESIKTNETVTTPAATDTDKTKTPTTDTPPSATPTDNQSLTTCQYHLADKAAPVETSVIMTFSEKATEQSFTFDPQTIDIQLTALKDCFTDQGWQSFNDALQKSGNVAAIKEQKLSVSSMVDGQISTASPKDNQWKVTVPLQVVYQNDKEKLTQLLNVELLVGRKPSGDLGIMQMIASPRKPETPANKTTEKTAAPVQEPAKE